MLVNYSSVEFYVYYWLRSVIHFDQELSRIWYFQYLKLTSSLCEDRKPWNGFWKSYLRVFAIILAEQEFELRKLASISKIIQFHMIMGISWFFSLWLKKISGVSGVGGGKCVEPRNWNHPRLGRLSRSGEKNKILQKFFKNPLRALLIYKTMDFFKNSHF